MPPGLLLLQERLFVRTFDQDLWVRLIFFVYEFNHSTMGKDKKSLDELKDDLKTINKSEQEKVRGGNSDKEKDKEKNKWNSGLGGIVPQ